jgi:hypothetical protein
VVVEGLSGCFLDNSLSLEMYKSIFVVRGARSHVAPDAQGKPEREIFRPLTKPGFGQACSRSSNSFHSHLL